VDIELKDGRVIKLPRPRMTVKEVKDFLEEQGIPISLVADEGQRIALRIAKMYETAEELLRLLPRKRPKPRVVTYYGKVLEGAVKAGKGKEVFSLLWEKLLRRIERATLTVRYTYKMFHDLLDLLRYITEHPSEFTEVELRSMFSKSFYWLMDYPVGDYERMAEEALLEEKREQYRERRGWLRRCIENLNFEENEWIKSKEDMIQAIKQASEDLKESLLYW